MVIVQQVFLFLYAVFVVRAGLASMVVMAVWLQLSICLYGLRVTLPARLVLACPVEVSALSLEPHGADSAPWLVWAVLALVVVQGLGVMLLAYSAWRLWLQLFL